VKADGCILFIRSLWDTTGSFPLLQAPPAVHPALLEHIPFSLGKVGLLGLDQTIFFCFFKLRENKWDFDDL
jgi:hypothetical protein